MSLPWHLAGIGAVLMILLMAALWALHLRLRNAAVVDVGWAGGLGLLACLYAALGPAPVPHRLLLLATAGPWAFRLALHLWRDRVSGGRPEEGRYRTLRAGWGARATRNFLGFFLAQGILDVLLSFPFLLAAANPEPSLAPLEWAGLGLFLIALAGESLADAQLKAWKSRGDPQGVCKAGLWRYSRHPNYFCEWLIWCAFALMASAHPSPLGYLAWLCPAAMLWLLLKVTGIPPTEAQSLRSRGDAYRRYQAETRAFFPWFPRNAPRSSP